MHLLRTESRSLDDTATAVDLEQTAAPLVFLSFTTSDLSALAQAAHAAPGLPDLRLASLAQLRHPYSVDLYLEKVAAHAEFILVRLLGGMDYWRYGVEELAALARNKGLKLAFIAGDFCADERLDAASTLRRAELRRLWSYFQEGGPENMAAVLGYMAGGGGAHLRKVEAFGEFSLACLPCDAAPQALIVFYRSVFLAVDTAPVEALAKALAARGFGVKAVYVTSLKDSAALAPLGACLRAFRPDVIFNMTAFSAQLSEGCTVLDIARAPVFQAILAGSSREQWAESSRGLSAADQAMNVVLPEVDGRIITTAISFKREAPRDAALQFGRVTHQPEPDGIAALADLGAAWAKLRRMDNGDKRIACVVSDYPAKGGRTGYAVGLDTPQSVLSIARNMRDAGYDIDILPEAPELMTALVRGVQRPVLSLEAYKAAFAALPEPFCAAVNRAWGAPEHDDALVQGVFSYRFVMAGKFIVAVQPERGRADQHKGDYHDTNLPPRHGYIAFYLWLRNAIDAMIHCGTHGTLEWLPGKAVALSATCAPAVILGAMPVIYPFIVNNPGEAAQAKRRLSAVTIGHLTPPLTFAGAHGVVAEIEGLFDEYAQAETLDARRAKYLAALLVAKADESGLFTEAGLRADEDALAALDAWLCDIKDMRIGDGLHVFGGEDSCERRAAHLDTLPFIDIAEATARLGACGQAEISGLLTALSGCFVPPGPAGAPGAGRLDVLPTGRNLSSIDPRAIPTRTAWEIGQRVAQELLNRYAQDHGEWPRNIVLDLWGSASMRTGGDDLAQAFALLGVRPTWDNGSTRVNGFEILPLSVLGRARVDVTLRISGLFRDIFPGQIALFDAAVHAVAALDEPEEENPLVAMRGDVQRIFGSAPGTYGVAVSAQLSAGTWENRTDLGKSYLSAGSFAYGKDGIGQKTTAFTTQIAKADAFVHVQDMAGQDILDSDAFATHEGGFAAAAEMLGARPTLYHADTSNGAPKMRSLAQEVARVLRGRASNPRWIAGQMRHGHRGAAEIAETVDNLFAYAALTDAVRNTHFEILFEATYGDEAVRAFLHSANPEAAHAVAAKFNEALERGLWICQRNSTRALLAEAEGRP